MSAIAGITQLSDSARARVRAMTAAQAFRGPGAQAVIAHDRVVFGHAGPAAAHTPAPGPQPFVDTESGCVITADIRLDNRRELRALLGVAPGADPGDAELALRSYLKWGSRFAENLLGDFAIGIWDARHARLTLTRDHFGARPVIYAATPDEIVFASTVGAVAEGSMGTHQANIDKFHHYFLDPLEALEPETTVLKGVLRVPAAHYVTWSPGESPRVIRYWRVEQPDELRLASDHEYHEAFRDVLNESVRCRVNPSTATATLFSGGLDSSAVLAAAMTSSTPRELLPVYAAVEEDAAREGSDAPHIEAVLKHFSHQDRVRRFSVQDAANEHDIDWVLKHPDSLFDSTMTFLWPITRAAAANDHHVLLTGLGGDELFYLSPVVHSWRLLQSGHLVQAAREMFRQEGVWRFPRRHLRYIAGQALPAPITRAIRSRRARNDSDDDPLAEFGFDPALSKLLQEQREAFNNDPEWNTEFPILNNLRRPFVTVGLERYDRVAARSGVEMRHPMLDKRFVEFCLSLPANQRLRDGWEKQIVRAACVDLPASVRWRPKSLVSQGIFWQGITDQYRQENLTIAGEPIDDLFGPMNNISTAEPAVLWQRAVAHRWFAKHPNR